MSRSLSQSFLVLVALFALPGFVLSASLNIHDGHDHTHSVQKRLPSTGWYQPDSHPAHALFKRGKRDASTDGTDYADVGSAGTCSRSFVYRALTRCSMGRRLPNW